MWRRQVRGHSPPAWPPTADAAGDGDPTTSSRPTPRPGEPARPIRMVCAMVGLPVVRIVPVSRRPSPSTEAVPAPRVASASARSSSAADVAPGSWCPTDRSPRYDARPFVASSGTVARAPASAASAIATATAAASLLARYRRSPGFGGRHERIEHGLLAGRRLAELLDPADRGVHRGDEVRGRSPPSGEAVGHRATGAHQRRAVQRSGRAADGADQGPPRGPQPCRRDGLRPLSLGSARRPATPRIAAKPAVHVRAVITVADGLVQRGQPAASFVDPVRGQPQPGVDRQSIMRSYLDSGRRA